MVDYIGATSLRLVAARSRAGGDLSQQRLNKGSYSRYVCIPPNAESVGLRDEGRGGGL